MAEKVSDDFLTVEQVEKLTGFKRKTSQLEFLRARSVASDINARGEVLVLWSQVYKMMAIKHKVEKPPPEPNWAALYEPGAKRRIK